MNWRTVSRISFLVVVKRKIDRVVVRGVRHGAITSGKHGVTSIQPVRTTAQKSQGVKNKSYQIGGLSRKSYERQGNWNSRELWRLPSIKKEKQKKTSRDREGLL
jgi:hypothetical protein